MEARKWIKTLCVLLLVGVSNTVFAGKTGIQFQSLNLEEALEVARSEKKLVFIDVFTTWCGPCKYLSSQVFTDNEVGDYYNAHFVSIKINAEAGEGPGVAGQFNVDAYPTLLYLNADGELIQKKEGAAGADVITYWGTTAVDPTLSELYQKRKRVEEYPDSKEARAALIAQEVEEGLDPAENVAEYLERFPKIDFADSDDLMVFCHGEHSLDDPQVEQFLQNYDAAGTEQRELIGTKVVKLIDLLMLDAKSMGSSQGIAAGVERLYPAYAFAFGDEAFTQKKLTDKLLDILPEWE